MKLVYNVNGIIEINLDKETTQAFNNALHGCSIAGENELDYNVNFKGLNIKSIKK